MKIRKPLFPRALGILGFITIILLVQTQKAQTMAAPRDQANPLPLIAYLVQLGEEYDYFFTIEVASDDTGLNRIDSQWIQKRAGKKHIQQELEQLRQTVPNFAYEVDKTNPRIVHAMDARLTHHKGYALDSIIKNINFTGKVNDLPSEIGKQGIPISPPLLMSFNETRDYSTVVQVKGTAIRVRDALTFCLPLDDRHTRFLWIASTRIDKKGLSYVYYPSPGKKP